MDGIVKLTEEIKNLQGFLWKAQVFFLGGVRGSAGPARPLPPGVVKTEARDFRRTLKMKKNHSGILARSGEIFKYKY